jgi:hypothetical protein
LFFFIPLDTGPRRPLGLELRDAETNGPRIRAHLLPRFQTRNRRGEGRVRECLELRTRAGVGSYGKACDKSIGPS